MKKVSVDVATTGYRLGKVAWIGSEVVWSEHGSLNMKDPMTGQYSKTFGSGTSAGIGYGGGAWTTTKNYITAVVAQQYIRVYNRDGAVVSDTYLGVGAACPTISSIGHIAFVTSDGVEDTISVIPKGSRTRIKLETGSQADFYSSPAWNSKGDKLAWIEWDHPNMPWSGTRLMVADYDKFTSEITNVVQVAGGYDNPIQQPEFTRNDELMWVDGRPGHDEIIIMGHDGVRTVIASDLSIMEPAWAYAPKVYSARYLEGVLYSVLAISSVGAGSVVKEFFLDSREPRTIKTPNDCTLVHEIDVSIDGGNLAVNISSPFCQQQILAMNIDTSEVYGTARSPASKNPDLANVIESAEPVSWPTSNDMIAHGILYLPPKANGEDTPLIVCMHGGPTMAYRLGWSPEPYYWCSRGYSVLYVNYRGSTGYGREYETSLNGNWGVYDPEDAVSGADYVSELGKCDRERVVIMGGSAGGYAVLQALSSFPSEFAGGVDMYGISDLNELLKETHKFEARYPYKLIGPLPECKSIYDERSPINHADKIVDPIAIYQGDLDDVVPIGQSVAIRDALKKRGVHCRFTKFSGEGHGFGYIGNIRKFYASATEFIDDCVNFKI